MSKKGTTMNRRSFCKLLGAAAGTSFVPSFTLAQDGSSKFFSQDVHKEVRYLMGTLLSITVYHSNKSAVRAFFNEAFESVAKMDRLLSNYKPDSEISLLNSSKSLKVSLDTYNVLELGKKYETLTEGIFNIGIGSVASVWKNSVPKQEDLKLLADSSSTKFVGLENQRKVNLANEIVQIDTGGIGKGYAVDKIVALFKKYSIESALINFGESTLYAHGAPPGQKAWNLALKFPNEAAKNILKLKDTAASASSALGQTYEMGSKKYGHIIDPRNAKPLTEKRCTAVLCSSAVEAEVLSSDAVVRNSILEINNKPIAGYLEVENKAQFFGDISHESI